MATVDFAREAYVRIEYIVYLASGDTHRFPDEEWARWFMDRHPSSYLVTATNHTFEGLHAGQRQSATREKP